MDSTHPRSRRHIVQGLAMLVAPTVAVACATGTPTAPTTTKAVAIAPSRPVNGFEFWQPWPIDQPTHGGPIGWKQLSEAFNSTTTNKVQVSTPAGDYIAAVQAAISAGTPPDGWQADQQWMVVYAAKGASAPLDDLIKRDKWDKASIFPSAYETMTWNGRVWGMMQHPDIVFMWYATGLLKETGADPAKLPMTWQDLDVVAQKATRKQGDGFDFVGFTPHLGTDWQVILAQSNGAKLVSDDGKIVQFDTPEVVEAIEWVKGHVTRLGGMGTIVNWQKLVPGGDGQAPGTPTAGADIFAQKRMAAVVGGNWTADNIRRANRRVTWPLIHSIASITSGASNCTTLPSSETSFAPFDWARMTCQSVPRCGVNPTKSKPSPCFLVAFCAATSRSCQVIGSLAGSTPFSFRRPVAYHMNTISGCCIIPQTRPFQVIVSYADGNIDALSHLSRLIKSSRGADAPFEA